MTRTSIRRTAASPMYLIALRKRLDSKLVNTPYKRYIVIGEGTHTVAIEKSRMHLINQVQSFLDE